MKHLPHLTAILLIPLALAGCASPSAGVKNASAVAIGNSLSLDNIQVETSSTLADSTNEQRSLSDAIISGLNETGLFSSVTTNKPGDSSANGIKIQADIRAIKKVSDDARDWTGSLAGEAMVSVHITVSDLKSRQLVESFDAEGKSGKSAWAGTTDEAVQLAASQIVAEVVKINAKTANKP